MNSTNIKITALSILLSTQVLFSQSLSVGAGQAVIEESKAVESGNAGDVAKKLANPIAAMISVPFQLNYQQNYGLNDNGDKWTLNLQPVVPMELNEDWNVISRTILPMISQDSLFAGSGTQSGIGDIVQSVWFSPKSPTENGWIWGAGPVFLIPTGSDVSAKKWGTGPTAVALKQDGHWTYGGLANHIWSTGGSDEIVKDISSTFIQPFLTYITPEAVSFTLMTETTYDWKAKQWSVPVYGMVTKVGKIGNQIVSYGGGINYWAESPNGGPEGWGARLILTFIFPK